MQGAGKLCHSRQDACQERPLVPEILNNLNASSFNRAMVQEATSLPTSSTSANKQSRIPMVAGIHRSSSFFGNLNAFAENLYSEQQKSKSRPATGIPRNTSFFSSLGTFRSKPSSSSIRADISASRQPTPVGIVSSSCLQNKLEGLTRTPPSSACKSNVTQYQQKQPRKISGRLLRTPFFNRTQENRPSSPSQTPREARRSSVKIEQRALMKPVHPSLPRSSTVGNLECSPGQGNKTHM